jgi:sec-independent protein translocase protein TatB
MPTIGWFEILVVVLVSIIVIGPKDFPFMLKKVGSWIGSAKKYINNIQNEISNLDLENIESINKKNKNKVKNKVKNNERS